MEKDMEKKESKEYPEKSKYFPYDSFKKYIKGKVLEIGCAQGNNTRFMKQKYGMKDKDMFCIELDMEKLKRAKSRINAHFINADARWLPFKDNTFDFAYCSEVIEHIPAKKDHSMVLDGMKRILKPGRYCIITTPNRWLYTLFCIITFKKKDKTHLSELNYGEFRRLTEGKFNKVYMLGIFGVFDGLISIRFFRRLHESLMNHPGVCKALVAICYKG